MTRPWVGLVLIAGMVIGGLAVYGQLPDQIPSHWNMQGEVDDWSGRWTIFIAPTVGLLMMLLMTGLRRIDPRKAHYERFEGTFWIVINMIVAFMVVVQVITIGAALEWPLPDIDRILMGAAGVLFIGLGNYMPRVKSNWWMGIRTPWTLSSEAVWRSTHRLGGRMFVLGGAILLVSVVLPRPAGVAAFVVAVLLSAVVPAVWSYLAWRREQQG